MILTLKHAYRLHLSDPRQIWKIFHHFSLALPKQLSLRNLLPRASRFSVVPFSVEKLLTKLLTSLILDIAKVFQI